MAFISRPNSWVARDDSATTRLTYALQLNPAPLTVSISGRDPILGSLQFVVTNPAASPVSVTSVAFTIQVGTASSNLTPSTATIGTSVSNNTDWQVQSPGAPITSGPATYTLAPRTGSAAVINAGASVVVEIFDFPTVEDPGSTVITVKETISNTIALTSFQVTTFPSGFFFNSLIATAKTGSQLLPVAQVVAGATVTLIWNSSVVSLASFVIYYSSASQGQQTASPTDTGSWTSPPLTSDTVFTVVVTVSVADGEPLTAAMTTGISVQNPALIAASIAAGQAAISGDTALAGAISVSGPSTLAALTAVSAQITGDQGLTTPNATVQTQFNAPGKANIGSLDVAGPLAAAGPLNVAGDFVASGPAALTGGLSAAVGNVSLLSGIVQIEPGSYSPSTTDALVVGYCGAPETFDEMCIWRIYGATSVAYVRSMGGMVGAFSRDWKPWKFQNYGSFLLPVPKGYSFFIAADQSIHTRVDVPVLFWWIPFGKSPAPTRVGDAPAPQEPLDGVEQSSPPTASLVPELVDIFEALAEKPMPAPLRQRLTRVLAKITASGL
jgi:hypothetical protein